MGVFDGLLNIFQSKRSAEEDYPELTEGVNNTIKKVLLSDDIVSSIPTAFYYGVSGKSLNVKTDTADDKYNETLDGYLREFFKAENFEVTKRVDFDEWVRIWSYHYSAFGGVLVRHHFDDSFKFGYKPEVIDTNRIASDYDLNGFKNGIKFGKWNEITAIRIFTDGTFDKSVTVSAKELTLFQTPLEDVHRYSPLSKISSSIITAKGLKEYNDAIIETQKQASKRGVFISSQFYAEQATLLTEKYKKLTRSQDPKDRYQAEQAKIELNNLLVMREMNSDVNIIPKGDEVTNMNMMNSINYTEIGGESKKIISSAMGLSPIDVYNENPSSYSNSLMGGKKSNQTYSTTAQKLFNNFIRIILENFVRGAISKGLVSATLFEYNISKYAKFKYYRTEIGHIDPIKEAKATETYLRTDVKTFEEVLQERGVDMDAHMESLVRSEKAKAKALAEIKKTYEENGLEYDQTDAKALVNDVIIFREEDD